MHLSVTKPLNQVLNFSNIYLNAPEINSGTIRYFLDQMLAICKRPHWSYKQRYHTGVIRQVHPESSIRQVTSRGRGSG